MDPASAALSVDIGKSLTITADLLANDDDAGDHLVFTSVTVTPGYGTIRFQRNTDTITYSAPGAGSADRTPVADTLDITISDGSGGNVRGSVSIKINDPAKVAITVTAAERPQANPPVAEDDTLTVASGGTASIDLLANDAGIGDPGDKVSAQLLTRPPASFGSVQLLNGVLSFVAAANASGVVRLQYSLTDGVGPTSTAIIALNVLPGV
jgi:hypothetical protein